MNVSDSDMKTYHVREAFSLDMVRAGGGRFLDVVVKELEKKMETMVDLDGSYPLVTLSIEVVVPQEKVKDRG